MGTEALWIPLALAAAGGTASAVNARNVAKKQESIQNRGIAAQAMRQRQADERLGLEISDQARSSPEAERAEALDNFESQLRASKTAAGGTTDVPMGSDRYQTGTAGAKADIQKYGGQLADITSRINAPIRQREREAKSRGRTGSDVAGIARNAQGDAWLTQLLSQSVRPNAALSIAGPMLTGASQAMAGGMGGASSSESLIAGQQAGMESVMEQLRKARRTPITI